MLLEDRELTERASKVEALLADIETFADPAVRAKASEMVESLVVLYGEGLARIMTIIDREENIEVTDRILEAFSKDDLVSHLLLLHDLHPVSLETRVSRALEEVRPYLQSHGGNVELLGIVGGVARLKLQGSCSGCPSSTMTLKLAIEEAIHKAAPDLEGIEAEGVAEPAPRPVAFLPASDLLKKKHVAADSKATWTSVGGLPGIAGDGMKAMEVSGRSVLFFKLDNTFFAYRNVCASCGQPMERGRLKGPELACPTCGLQFDIRRAGRCLEVPDQHLEPIPLLIQDDIVKVAVS